MEQQRIVCAAILIDRRLVLGVRHFDLFMRDGLKALGLQDKHSRMVQGFVDNKGQFLDREKALVVAQEAGQVIRECLIEKEGRKELFSEDLY